MLAKQIIMVVESWENQVEVCDKCETSKKINVSYEDKIETLIEMFGSLE